MPAPGKASCLGRGICDILEIPKETGSDKVINTAVSSPLEKDK